MGSRRQFWKRDWLFWTVAGLLVGLASGVAWLSRNPHTLWVDRAATWPAIGSLAQQFRARYPQPPVAPDRRQEAESATEPGDRTPEAEFGARPSVWISSSTPLYATPRLDSEILATLEPVTRLVQRERRQDWYGVAWGDETAWVYLPDYSETADPPLGMGVEPPGPVPDLAPEPERLAEARRLLVDEAVTRVGAYHLYTDVVDATMVSSLSIAVPSLEVVYHERTGLRPIDQPRAAIVLFESRLSYERFKAKERSLAGRPSSGHVGRGVVALYRQGREQSEVHSTLLHELVHLLNRRAIGPALPPWLDEGLAEDFSGAAVSDAGRLQPGTLAPTLSRDQDRWRATGSQAALIGLQRQLAAHGSLPAIRDVVGFDEEEFHASGERAQHYALAGFLIRYLFAEHGDAFRGFLASVADGGSARAEALLQWLGQSWSDLDTGFTTWIEGWPSPLEGVVAIESRAE